MFRSTLAAFFLPPGTRPDAGRVLWARALRAFGDGYMSLLLPFYLTLLGFSALEVGVIVTSTLLGSGAMTLAIGFIAHRFRGGSLLQAAAFLMAATGVAFVLVTDFWPLLLVAFMGTLNPSSGDVSVFLPLEHALLSQTVTARSRTALFARYSLIGALVGALGAQAAGVPALAQLWLAVDLKTALQGMFLFYGALGMVSLGLYHRLPPRPETPHDAPATPLGKSKRMVYRLAALFGLDAFAGGFAVQSLLALWLFERFELSIITAGTVFFWVGIFSALSQLASARVAARFGLINTMVFTHLPSNVFLILVPLMPTLPLALVFLFLRSALSQMDVPARTSYVMAVVSPGERPAAASITAVPRSLAAAVSPAFAGYLLSITTFGWPLVICGGLKIVYDLLLLKMFSKVRPPEESK
ncbi:MAG: MFS transporter [Betaproteobacteria bacterium]|nr:MFS transporter [Betaproteobacteria bacterium]